MIYCGRSWEWYSFALTHVNKLASSFSSVPCASFRIASATVPKHKLTCRIWRSSFTFRPQRLKGFNHACWLNCQSVTQSPEKLTWRCHWCSKIMTWWNLSRVRRVSREGVNWKGKESGIINSRYVLLYGCRYDFFSWMPRRKVNCKQWIRSQS